MPSFQFLQEGAHLEPGMMRTRSPPFPAARAAPLHRDTRVSGSLSIASPFLESLATISVFIESIFLGGDGAGGGQGRAEPGGMKLQL